MSLTPIAIDTSLPRVAIKSPRYSIYHSFLQRELVYFFFQSFRKSKREHINNLSKRFDNVLSFLKKKLTQFNGSTHNTHNIHNTHNTDTNYQTEWSLYLKYFYTLIAYVREERGEHEITYMMLYVLFDHFPNLLDNFVQHFVTIKHDKGPPAPALGCWRDVIYLSDYFFRNAGTVNHPVIGLCVYLINKQLASDIHTCSKEHISNVSKWIPREHKKFDWLYTELVINWFSTYAEHQKGNKPFTLMKKIYRKHVSKLNTLLDTTQIHQCSQKYGDITPKKVSKLTYEKQTCLLYDPHDDTQKKECNTYCREYLTNKYIDQSIDRSESNLDEDLIKQKKKRFQSPSFSSSHSAGSGYSPIRYDNDIPVSYFIKEAFALLKLAPTQDATVQWRIQLLNAKWEIYIQKYLEIQIISSNILPVVDISFSMQRDEETYYTAIGLAILIAQLSLLGKRILCVDNMPTWINLTDATTLYEMVDVFNKHTQSSRSTVSNILAAIDIVAYSIHKSGVSQQSIDKLQLVILSDFASYTSSDINDLTLIMDTPESSLHKNIIDRFTKYIPSNDARESHSEMREGNGHVFNFPQSKQENIPVMIYWNLSKTGCVDLPTSIYEPNTMFLAGFSPMALKRAIKCKHNNPYGLVCSVLQHPKYEVLYRSWEFY